MLWLSSTRRWRDTVYFSAARWMILFWILRVRFVLPGCLHYNHRPGRCNGKWIQTQTAAGLLWKWCQPMKKKLYMAWSLCWRRLSTNHLVCLFCCFFFLTLWMLFLILVTYHHFTDSANKVLLLNLDTVYDVTMSIIHFNTVPSLRITSFLGACTQ